MLVVLISPYPDYYRCGNSYGRASRTQRRSAFARLYRLGCEFLQNFPERFFRNFGFCNRRKIAPTTPLASPFPRLSQVRARET
jgi:hypothetical protein